MMVRGDEYKRVLQPKRRGTHFDNGVWGTSGRGRNKQRKGVVKKVANKEH